MVRARGYSSGGGSLAPPGGGARRQRFPYMFEFRQGTLLCRVIYYPSLPVSIPIWEPCALGEARAACDYMLQLLEPTS